jgi:hypothetical protein
MMKFRGFAILLCFLLVCGSISAVWTKAFYIRPITIKILDKVTGQPLENIPVYYVITSQFQFQISPEPFVREKLEVVEQYHSNSQGGIRINGRTIYLSRWNSKYIRDEDLFINLERWGDAYKKDKKFDMMYLTVVLNETDGVYNPNPKYHGYFVRNSNTDEYKKEQNVLGGAFWNGKSLSKKEENLTIELEPWENK